MKPVMVNLAVKQEEPIAIRTNEAYLLAMAHRGALVRFQQCRPLGEEGLDDSLLVCADPEIVPSDSLDLREPLPADYCDIRAAPRCRPSAGASRYRLDLDILRERLSGEGQ